MPSPKQLSIDPESDALLVVDLQRDFLPGGALAVPGGDEIVQPIARLARAFRTVVATQDFHPPGHVSFASSHPGRRPFQTLALPGGEQTLWPDHCVAGTPGAALAPGLPDERLTLVLRKGTRREVDSSSAFCENPEPDGRRSPTGLSAWLRARGVRRLFVVGLARDVCVRASALDAAALGFDTFVVDDCTRAVDPAGEPALRRELAARGVGSIGSAGLRTDRPTLSPAAPRPRGAARMA